MFASLAVDAEQAGWDGVFVWDHMVVWSGNLVGDPWILLAAAAAATERIALGPMVTPLPRRRPWKLAREAVTLDQLSGGRLILGVGIGFPPEPEFTAFGEPTEAKVRAEMLDEGLEIITGLWTGRPFGFRVVTTTSRRWPFYRPQSRNHGSPSGWRECGLTVARFAGPPGSTGSFPSKPAKICQCWNRSNSQR